MCVIILLVLAHNFAGLFLYQYEADWIFKIGTVHDSDFLHAYLLLFFLQYRPDIVIITQKLLPFILCIFNASSEILFSFLYFLFVFLYIKVLKGSDIIFSLSNSYFEPMNNMIFNSNSKVIW